MMMRPPAQDNNNGIIQSTTCGQQPLINGLVGNGGPLSNSLSASSLKRKWDEACLRLPNGQTGSYPVLSPLPKKHIRQKRCPTCGNYVGNASKICPDCLTKLTPDRKAVVVSPGATNRPSSAPQQPVRTSVIVSSGSRTSSPQNEEESTPDKNGGQHNSPFNGPGGRVSECDSVEIVDILPAVEMPGFRKDRRKGIPKKFVDASTPCIENKWSPDKRLNKQSITEYLKSYNHSSKDSP